jgi:branched-chain amino acid aminotransferase
MNLPDYLWMDGKMVRWADATVHVMAHALHYGSSVFEGIRCYRSHRGPAIFRLDDHIERLFDSARVYRMRMPFNHAEIVEACRQAVRDNGLESAYIRPIALRGFSGIGLAAPDNAPVHVAVGAVPFGAYLGEAGLREGIDACVSSWNRAAPNTVPTMAKAGGNYLNSQLITMEAQRQGCKEGIALSRDGLLSEGSGENLFIVRKGVLYTPPAAASILVGITRDTVLTLAHDIGLKVIEQAMPREFLYVADEVFMTGTAAEITPVRSVDGMTIGKGACGPITASLQERFFGLFDGRTEDRWGWLDIVEPATRGSEALAVVA